RQRGAVPYPPLLRQPAGGAGTGRWTGSDGGGRVRRPAAGSRWRGSTPVIARAFAPASVANVAVGFDILGHAIAGVGDTVSVRRIDEPVVRIEAIRGSAVELPLEAAGNTAGAALMSLRAGLDLDFGFAVEIDK